MPSSPRRTAPADRDEQRERHGDLLDGQHGGLRHAEAAARFRPDRRAVREQDAEATRDRGDLARVRLQRLAGFEQDQGTRIDRARDVAENVDVPEIARVTITRYPSSSS